jgi:hypothetical protein
MADKRISQLIERTDIANNDVLPIVASGATTTNKVTISTIQDWMQDNLDVGVTSVGITLGTTGTDVNVSGSPITTSGNITINIPDASTSARGVVTTGTQTFAGNKSFQNTIFVNAGLRLDQNGTALPTFVQNISGTGLISSGSNGLGFNSANNLYFSGSEKGGAVLAVNNSAVRTYTLQDANGTLAFTSDLTGYVTLGTAQTITAQKTFTTSGSSDTMIISHGSGSGIALDVIKAGNSEAIRVQKTSGSGNAVTITGGTLSAEAGQFSGDLQTSTRISATSGSNAITITPNVGGTQNRIETTGTLPLSLVSADAITMAAGGTTPQITLATTGAVTLTGALNGTSATLTGALNGTSATFTAVGMGVNVIGVSGNPAYYVTDQSVYNSGKRWRFGYTGAIGGFSSFDFYNETDNLTALTLASTGAATFSSSVTATTGLTVGSLGSGSNAIITLANNASGSPRTIYYKASDATINFTGTGGGDQVTITNGGNVGIGVTPSTWSNGYTALQVGSTSALFDVSSLTILSNNQYYNGGDLYLTTDSASRYVQYDGLHIWSNAPSGTAGSAITFTERMRITSGGNVGIGTASPTATLDVNSGTTNIVAALRSTDAGAYLAFADPDTTLDAGFPTSSCGVIGNNFLISTANTERMRITSGGNIDMGTQVGNSAERLRVVGIVSGSSQYGIFTELNSTLYNGFIARFLNTATSSVVGSITQGVSAVSYNTSSDYRLKEDLQEINGLEKVSALKVYDFKWKNTEERMDGVLAHELAEVLPYAVHGQKDEVDEEGKEIMQGVDYSKIVPILIKAIQELKTEIDSLKNQMQ